MKEKKTIKISLSVFVVGVILIITVFGGSVFILYNHHKRIVANIENEKNLEQETTNVAQTEKQEIQAKQENAVSKSEYKLTSNKFSRFDLSFLKFENNGKNMIYSPLSIKYAFKMLEEGTTGNSKSQLSSIVGGYNLTKYKTNKNLALANAFFIKSNDKEEIKKAYIDLLKSKYDADIVFDDFSTAKNVNNWIKQHTLGLIDKLYSDDDVKRLEFALINSLGIDMEWNHKFLEYYYEDDKNIKDNVDYHHEKVYWAAERVLKELDFDDNKKASSMRVYATLNNYDIVKDLGEAKIKQIVKEEFIKWAKNDCSESEFKDFFNLKLSDANIEKAFEMYWEEGNFSTDNEKTGYMEEISENYGKVDYSTDFSLYVDDSVKVFSKDLKQYDGTVLQYVGIMPKKQNLTNFVKNTSETEINGLISKLKDLKLNNFKDGVLTKITGKIPKFKFEYELQLQEDLEKLGVTDIFEQGKANLTQISDREDLFINNVKHKANIEFTEDGIKAAATTAAGGMGGGGFFDYWFDIPTEEIDITFDKPYMFIIRDKDTGETWFTGAVYEPLDVKDELGDIEKEYNE